MVMHGIMGPLRNLIQGGNARPDLSEVVVRHEAQGTAVAADNDGPESAEHDAGLCQAPANHVHQIQRGSAAI